MTDEAQAPASTLAYHPAMFNCPRCNHPLKARVTQTVSKVHLIKCTHCAWMLDIEAIRKSIKSVATPIDDTAPTTPQEDIE